MCRIETAGTFYKAEELLNTGHYDMVILDVMGVKGLDLLDIAVGKDFPCVMLTAPALSLTISSKPCSGAQPRTCPKKTSPISIHCSLSLLTHWQKGLLPGTTQ